VSVQEFYQKFSVFFVILLNLSVIRKFRGSCSSVEMLKRYIVRERLGTRGLERFQYSAKVKRKLISM